MDQVHLHLISNHIPVIGAFFGAVVLAVGMARKNPSTLTAAYLVFILSAVTGLIAFFTGGGAEEAVKDLPGVEKSYIEAHSQMALYTLIAFVLLAVLSLIGIFRSKKPYEKIRGLAVVIFIVSLIGLGISAYTSMLGGQIRHTEIRSK